MAVLLSIAAAISAVDAMTARVDLGTTNPQAAFTVYSGPVPTRSDAALDPANIALVTIAMNADAFGDATDNTDDLVAEAIAGAIAETPALADGTATFYRQFDRDGNVVWQGVTTEANLGGDMELSAINVVTGVNVVVQSYALRIPYAVA